MALLPLGRDEVELVLLLAAGETRVSGLDRERVVTEDEDAVVRGALALVDRRRVPVGEVASLQVVERQLDEPALVELDHQAVIRQRVGDAVVVVQDREAVIVAMGEDLVPDCELHTVHLDQCLAELAVAEAHLAGSCVEVGDG